MPDQRSRRSSKGDGDSRRRRSQGRDASDWHGTELSWNEYRSDRKQRSTTSSRRSEYRARDEWREASQARRSMGGTLGTSMTPRPRAGRSSKEVRAEREARRSAREAAESMRAREQRETSMRARERRGTSTRTRERGETSIPARERRETSAPTRERGEIGSRTSSTRPREGVDLGDVRRNLQALMGFGVLVLGLVLVVVAVRGVVGFASGIFSKGGEPQESAQEEAAQSHETVRIELAMIGDILQHSGVYESGFMDDGTRNYDHVFAHIGSALQGADIKVVNQETILGGDAFEFSGYPNFNGPQEMGDAEAKAGFNVVLRATNHAMDMGYEGLSSELTFWRTKHPEVAVIGAVDPELPDANVDDPYIFEKNGFTVALLNYTLDLNGYEDPKGVVSILEEEHIRTTVSAAKKAADMVVVFPHWGDEYELQPMQWQRDMAEVFLESGADVIIGGHPHVIEPVEVLTAPDGRRVPCFWSVGNFISTQIDDQCLVGGVAKVTLEKATDGTCAVKGCSFVPTVTHKGVGADMTTYLLRDYTDDLAMTNYLWSNETDNSTLTVAWANEFCTEVLGPSFNTTTEELVLKPDAFVAGAPSASSAEESTAAESDEASGSSEEEPAAEELDQAA